MNKINQDKSMYTSYSKAEQTKKMVHHQWKFIIYQTIALVIILSGVIKIASS